jgi:hypothetical protein
MAIWRSRATTRGVFVAVNEIRRGIPGSPVEECLLRDDDQLPRSLWSPSGQPLWPEQPQMWVPIAAVAVVLTAHTMMGLLRWSATRYGMIWARMGEGQGIAYVILESKSWGGPPVPIYRQWKCEFKYVRWGGGSSRALAPPDKDGGRTHHCETLRPRPISQREGITTNRAYWRVGPPHRCPDNPRPRKGGWQLGATCRCQTLLLGALGHAQWKPNGPGAILWAQVRSAGLFSFPFSSFHFFIFLIFIFLLF